MWFNIKNNRRWRDTGPIFPCGNKLAQTSWGWRTATFQLVKVPSLLGISPAETPPAFACVFLAWLWDLCLWLLLQKGGKRGKGDRRTQIFNSRERWFSRKKKGYHCLICCFKRKIKKERKNKQRLCDLKLGNFWMERKGHAGWDLKMNGKSGSENNTCKVYRLTMQETEILTHFFPCPENV